MKILFTSNRLPYAGVAGGYSIIYQRIAGLAARGHEVGLVAFSRGETPEQIADIKRYLIELELVPPPGDRGFFRKVLDYLFSSVPSRFRSYRSQEMKKRIGDMVNRTHYTVVITEFARMGQHLYKNPYLPAVRKVVSCHRSLSMLHEKEVDVMGFSPRALFQRMRLKGMESFEFQLYRNADHVLVLTAQERYWLLSRMPGVHVTVVPSGVDVAYYRPDALRPRAATIVFTGNFHDPSNEDAALWFMKEGWPVLKKSCPDAVFYVVGPCPTEAMRVQAARFGESVRITGWVDDLRTYLHMGGIFICPVRVGAGLRTKVLEAMAAGMPVVSTALGVAGIPAQVGENCFLADQMNMMAHYVELLLNDPEIGR